MTECSWYNDRTLNPISNFFSKVLGLISGFEVLFIKNLEWKCLSDFEPNEPQKITCVACNAVITVKHNLIECTDFLEISKKYFEERSLHPLFRNVIPEIIFEFLREIGVFYKIWSVWRKCLCEVFLKSCLKILCETFYNLFNE